MTQETPAPEPQDPRPKPSALATIVKIFAYFIAGAFVLTVLIFGTCLLLLRH